MFCIVSWPDTSLVLKCCIASLQEQNLLVHQFAMIAAKDEKPPVPPAAFCSVSSPQKCGFASKDCFFFPSYSSFSDMATSRRKKPLTRRGSSGWPLRSLPVIGCYQRSPLSKQRPASPPFGSHFTRRAIRRIWSSVQLL